MERGFKFKIDKIEVANLNIRLPKDDELIKQNQLEYNYFLKFDVNNHIVTCIVHVLYFLEGDDNGKPVQFSLLHIDIMFDFYVEDLSTYLSERESGKWYLERFVHQTIAMMAFSTSRGIIYEKTRGTALNDYYFPIVKPNDFDENRLFEINSSPNVSELPSEQSPSVSQELET